MNVAEFAKPAFTIGTLAVIFMLEGAFPHYPGRVNRMRHAKPHLACAVINAVLNWAVLASIAQWVISLSGAKGIGVLQALELDWRAEAILGIIMFDLYMYYWHMANHKIGFLWRFHRAHHADIDMDTTTALRFHPGELVLSSIARVPVIIAIGMDLKVLLVYELALNISALFHHSNVSLPAWLDRALRIFVTTPEMHRVHHSVVLKETGSNFTSLLSVWDRIFGTFQIRADSREITIGLPMFRESYWQGLLGFIKTPLV